MIEPQDLVVALPDGGEKTYVMSKFPAVSGREIVCKYPLSGLPKIGDYNVNEETMLKLMQYVAVKTDSGQIELKTRSLVDNHVPDFETLIRIEVSMMQYNCSFFRQGKISPFLDIIKAKAQQLISSTLTDSLGQLLQTEKQPSESSKKSTV